METPQEGAGTERFSVKASSDSHFAWLRTRLSVERTLMSWARTAVSLIGFGFTIVQFFERLGSMPGAEPPRMPDAPRYLGLSLIAAGVLALLISIRQYHQVIAYLRSGSFARLAGIGDSTIYTPLYAVSIALVLIGLFAFFAVLTRSI